MSDTDTSKRKLREEFVEFFKDFVTQTDGGTIFGGKKLRMDKLQEQQHVDHITNQIKSSLTTKQNIFEGLTVTDLMKMPISQPSAEE